MHSIQNKGVIDYSLELVSSYAKQFIILFPSNTKVPSPPTYLYPLAVPSEEPFFIPASVCDILLNTICKEVEDGSYYRNITLRED